MLNMNMLVMKIHYLTWESISFAKERLLVRFQLEMIMSFVWKDIQQKPAPRSNMQSEPLWCSLVARGKLALASARTDQGL